jgi:hypothetical protein
LPVNDPVALAGVRAAFERYERALNDNDVAVLDELFLDAPETLRYGIREQLYGYAAIKSFRSAREPIDLRRELTRVVITTYGADFAVASCEYRRIASGREGRQMQTWLRTEAGWKVVAAHVSLSLE